MVLANRLEHSVMELGLFYALDTKPEPQDGKVWGKQVDPVMREYITTKLCRRDVADRYFQNPPRRPPTGDCCDNCVQRSLPTTTPNNSTLATEQQESPPFSEEQRPETPESSAPSPSSSVHSTPSKNKNNNNKRPMVRGKGPQTRKKEHLRSAREALERWRLRTYLEKYSKSCFPEVGIMPDTVLTSLASKRVESVEDLKKLNPPWMLADRHGEEVLKALSKVDDTIRSQKEQEKAAKKIAKHAETLARQAARAAVRAAAAKPRGGRGRGLRRLPLASRSLNVGNAETSMDLQNSMLPPAPNTMSTPPHPSQGAYYTFPGQLAPSPNPFTPQRESNLSLSFSGIQHFSHPPHGSYSQQFQSNVLLPYSSPTPPQPSPYSVAPTPHPHSYHQHTYTPSPSVSNSPYTQLRNRPEIQPTTPYCAPTHHGYIYQHQEMAQRYYTPHSAALPLTLSNTFYSSFSSSPSGSYHNP
ncbi:hypothetical protein C8R45DRAFT_1084266 [Mycena sanguinolenta]|nr:hypothetical protein C8R45DRAFT_1084266 [Mycena sanguinolenta]